MVAFTYDRSATDHSEAPATEAFAITPHDVNELAYVTRGVYIGDVSVGGVLDVVMADGTTVQFTGLVAGMILPIRVRMVLTTSTAAGLVGLV